jgi:hypothetical protein
VFSAAFKQCFLHFIHHFDVLVFSEIRSQHRQEQAKAGEEHDRRLAAYDELLDKYRHALGALGSGSSAGRTVARAAHAIDDADALSDEAADAARRQL